MVVGRVEARVVRWVQRRVVVRVGRWGLQLDVSVVVARVVQ